MPGHKGQKFHGLEALDITEIKGADYLFESEGIIAQSEAKMAEAYGSRRTFYSAEGSSLCIKAMLGIVCRSGQGKKITVAAPRNVHKAFINACILLDIDVEWIYPKGEFTSICAGSVTPEEVEKVLAETEVDCVYVTSPDYLGDLSDIKGMSEVCRKYGVPLLCDNAHGAYLKFLPESLHPWTWGLICAVTLLTKHFHATQGEQCFIFQITPLRIMMIAPKRQCQCSAQQAPPIL